MNPARSKLAAATETRIDLRAPPVAPTRAAAFRYWWKLGWISFGGPAGQIAIMHHDLVEPSRLGRPIDRSELRKVRTRTNEVEDLHEGGTPAAASG